MNDRATEAALAEGALVRCALGSDPDAIRELVDLLSPVVQRRVARVLSGARGRRCQHREPRQDVCDFVQAVFLALFDDDARILRSWDPSRGLSLKNFVGVVAEHQAISLLRSGRTNPWTEEPTECGALDAELGTEPDGDERVSSREMLSKLLDRLRVELSPTGLLLFELLLVEDRSALEVSKQTGMTSEALHQWRSRLGKLVRRLGPRARDRRTGSISAASTASSAQAGGGRTVTTLLDRLVDVARAQARSTDLDPWDRLVSGESSPAEEKELRRFAESDTEAAFSYELYAPLAAEERSAIVDAIVGIPKPTATTKAGESHDGPARGAAAPFDRRYRFDQNVVYDTMSHVISAHDVVNDRPVTIRVVPLHRLTPWRATARTCERADLRFQEDQVVRVLEGGVEGAMAFVVTEPVEGCDLARLLQSGALDFPTAVDLVLKVCRVLQKAHAAGVAHQALDLSNVFLTTRAGGPGIVKVIDFGLSAVPEPDGLGDRPRYAWGAPECMSPEQLVLACPADIRSNIWSLGAILYELLTASRAFSNGSDVVTLWSNGGPEPSLKAWRADLPSGLLAVVRRCLQRDPALRFANVAELTRELESFATWRARDLVTRVEPSKETWSVVRSTPRAAHAQVAGRTRRALAYALSIGVVGGLGFILAFAKVSVGVSEKTHSQQAIDTVDEPNAVDFPGSPSKGGDWLADPAARFAAAPIHRDPDANPPRRPAVAASSRVSLPKALPIGTFDAGSPPASRSLR